MVPKAEDLNKPESNLLSLDPKDPDPKSGDPKPVSHQPIDTAEKPSPSGKATSETTPESLTSSDNLSSAVQPKDHPATPEGIPIDYSSIQTTTQDINPDGYGVVVTDTGMTLGSVEVSTFRFSDEAAPTTEPTNLTEPTKPNEQSPSIEHPSTPASTERSAEPLESHDTNSHANEFGADDSNTKETADEVLDGLPVTQSAETAIEPATTNPKSPRGKQASEKLGAHSTNRPTSQSVQSRQQPKATQKSSSPKKTANRSQVAKNAEATGQVTGPENTSTTKRNKNRQSDQTVTADAAKTSANELKNQAQETPQAPNPENLLPVTFSNENKWFQEMMAFTKSSELMLRYLVVALLTGLGLSFVVGDWTFIAAIGYVVAIPGLFVLAVTGADITKQTISGCRMVEQWTSWNIKQILNQSLLVILSFVFAVIPGAVLSIPFILSTSSYVLTSILGALSFLLLFPIFVLSMIENKSNAQPFSAAIFGSLKNQTKNWWNFFGVSLLSAFLVLIFSFFITFGGGFLVCFFATLGTSMIAFVYFRMLGLHYRTLFPRSPEIS